MLAPPRAAELPEITGYRVERVLGYGGMGIVYRAWHLRLDRAVALKMLLAGPYARPEQRDRFLREAQAVAALRHPNIVQVHDAGEANGRPYFTMELVEGGDLAEQVRGVPQPARKAAGLVAMIADAVHTAHQSGIVHRDLKPNNILLTEDRTPKVTDFGLARRIETGDLTFTGAPLGSPSYMAPEQARGDKGAIGPATDVYALGAILYELLTGRPPFRSDTVSATLHQVATEEPVPPRRLNARVPRHLETICLKCLQKEPYKRYASAQALAEDLRRFERGEPIQARPVGKFERAGCWIRRRPALAAALACGLLLASALIVTVFWWHAQQTTLEAEAVAYAEADLNESERLRDRGEFKASAAVLGRAKDRLGDIVPPELRARLATAFDNLDLVIQLDAIRLERALVKPQALVGSPTELLGVLPRPMNQVSKDGQAFGPEALGRHYQEAFLKAGIGAPGDDPAEVAAHVRASPVRNVLVSALDDWSACAADPEQQAWVLAVVRHADPDSWRDRVRDPKTWDNAAALRELAERAPVAQQSPQLLAVLGARLRAKKLDAVRFLERVASAYPGDFWVNVEMGNALCERSDRGEAIGYYRTALALRPDTLSLRYSLGDLYLGQKRWDGAITEYEHAARLDPENAWCHNRLGFALAWKTGHEDEAIAQFQKAIRIDADNGWSHYFLAIALENKGSLDEAIDEFQKTARLFPEKRTESSQRARGLLLRLGRGAEARAAWKEELADHPARHDEWFGYAELCLFLGDETEYRRARRELLAQFGSSTDSVVAERVGRACLLLTGTEDEVTQAAALTERAVNSKGSQYDWSRPYFHFANGLAHYRRGRFDDAIATMTGDASKAAEYMGPSPRLVRAMALHKKGQKDEARELLTSAVDSYDWSADKATSREAWIAHILRREAEALIFREPAGPG
jgi:serine/threonine-protein kinase